MPPPSTEHDLKRRARRRLIGAVALTLLAVIVLPLLLEDEPPPASSLAVKMAASPATEARDEAAPSGNTGPLDAPIVADATQLAPLQPEVTEPAPPQSVPIKPAPKSDPATPTPEPSKPAPRPAAKPAKTTAPETRPAAASEAFVVQLAALSDAVKAQALEARAAKVGLPAYTDTVGKLTRVRVGPYASRAAAVAAAVKLAENGMSGQVVTK
jgi:DedD protein